MNENTIKLSVVIPYYNAQKYISKCLDSLMNQELKEHEYEIIVIDDGSTENTEVLINSSGDGYCDRYSQIKYYRQENARSAAARNNGISKAVGEYVFFCDSDDFIEDNVLGRLLKIATMNNLDILFFNRFSMSGNKEINKDFDSPQNVVTGEKYFEANPAISGGPWHYITKRNHIVKNELQFDVDLIYFDDRKFLIQNLMAAKRVSYVNVDVYHWLQHSESISHMGGRKQLSKQYFDGFLYFVKFTKIIEVNKSEKVINGLEQQRNLAIFKLLSSVARFGDSSKAEKYINELKLIDCYPMSNNQMAWIKKTKKYRVLLILMKHEKIWLTICKALQYMPS